MIEYRTASSTQPGILGFFRRRIGHGREEYLHNVAYHLMAMILGRHDFDEVASLVTFCENPDNLQTWLPSEADRIVFSDMLVERLRTIPSDSSTNVPIML